MFKIITYATLLIFFFKSSYSIDVELSLDSLNDALEKATNEIGTLVIQENETEANNSNDNKNIENVSNKEQEEIKSQEPTVKVKFPYIINLKHTEFSENCGTPVAKFTFYENFEYELNYVCPESKKAFAYNGEWKNISEEPVKWLGFYEELTTNYDSKGELITNSLQLDITNLKISWDNFENYQVFNIVENDQVSIFLESQATLNENQDKEINKSLGGYKDFYFDMNIAQIKNVLQSVCPEVEFTDKDFLDQPMDHWVATLCLPFKGKNRTLEFYPNDEGTIDKIVIKDVDSSLDSMDIATYFSKDESGYAVYDELVSTFNKSDKYNLVRYPSTEEIDAFNSFDNIKILTNEASLNTIFKNADNENLVYLTLDRTKYNNYGYDFNIIYFSQSASKKMISKEKSNTVTEDDI